MEQGVITPVTEEVKKRGGWLTFWLIWLLIGSAYGIISPFLASQTDIALAQSLTSTPTWFIYLGSIGNVINVISLILIFNWKKLGYFLFLAVEIILVLIQLVIGGFSVTAISLEIFSLLLGPGLLYLFMRSRWTLFV